MGRVWGQSPCTGRRRRMLSTLKCLKLSPIGWEKLLQTKKSRWCWWKWNGESSQVVVLTGAGEHFSSGNDLGNFLTAVSKGRTYYYMGQCLTNLNLSRLGNFNVLLSWLNLSDTGHKRHPNNIFWSFGKSNLLLCSIIPSLQVSILPRWRSKEEQCLTIW